ncbi:MAG: two pore domain potassium channel family protein [Bauldia sp.]|uniref:potassium channel family protein n=1 Tax=Bauldia sp. TaxID=2575872 RepID=UPI001D97020F|nr:potassium channel family protein [Bauldia sp.]MCB1494367.1 two pore domain potassium channel family protein [Bauldia sp.]
MFSQILFGAALLALSAMLYVVTMVPTSRLVTREADHPEKPLGSTRAILLVGVVALAVVFGHTVVVWIWSTAFVLSGALPNMEQSVYFTLVTYTTLGYGDLTLSEEFRVFGTMAAVTGLLNFGISTAFLVGVISRILPHAHPH